MSCFGHKAIILFTHDSQGHLLRISTSKVWLVGSDCWYLHWSPSMAEGGGDIHVWPFFNKVFPAGNLFYFWIQWWSHRLDPHNQIVIAYPEKDYFNEYCWFTTPFVWAEGYSGTSSEAANILNDDNSYVIYKMLSYTLYHKCDFSVRGLTGKYIWVLLPPSFDFCQIPSLMIFMCMVTKRGCPRITTYPLSMMMGTGVLSSLFK